MSYPQAFTHVLRYTHPDAEGLLDGTCYITPKLDGTNAVAWYDQTTDTICAGSRKRQLNLIEDNASFYNWLLSNNEEAVLIRNFLQKYPQYILYGEWGVGRVASIKDYKTIAHDRLWLFDIYDVNQDKYLHPEDFYSVLEKMNLKEYAIPLLAVIENPTEDQLLEIAKNNYFLLDPNGPHAGEGIVIRRPDFLNQYGLYRIGKLVLDEFVQKKRVKKTIAPGEAEQEIVQKFVTDAELSKAIEKVCGLCGVEHFDISQGKMIGMYLNMVFHDAIMEDGIVTYIKKHKKAIIDFGQLRLLSDQVARQYIGLN